MQKLYEHQKYDNVPISNNILCMIDIDTELMACTSVFFFLVDLLL